VRVRGTRFHDLTQVFADVPDPFTLPTSATSGSTGTS
jgi:hypothetical protein